MSNPIRRIVNNHALGQVVRPVYRPDAALAIGDAEDLSPQPILIMDASFKQDPVTPVISQLDQLKSMGGWGESIEESDFPHTGYLGEALV